jgi:formylglycine-generating enzyme required for sulfatase activity
MKKTAILSLVVLILIGLTSYGVKSKKSFEKFLKKSAYTFVPSGKTFVDGKETTVNAFYMSKGEVTNFQYQEFLSYLKKNNELDKLKICQVDSAGWSSKTSSNKGMQDFYHSHPAYRNYPVVNITHEAAELYCEFVRKALGEAFPGTDLVVRLPSYAEYVRAARGDNQNMRYGWNSNETRNKDGQILGNFTRIGEECVSRNPETGKFEINLNGISPVADGSSDVLAPSESYWPNQFGIYNLSGNAAEMINTPGIAYGGAWNSPGYDVRIESKREFTGADKAVGFRVVFSYLEK